MVDGSHGTDRRTLRARLLRREGVVFGGGGAEHSARPVAMRRGRLRRVSGIARGAAEAGAGPRVWFAGNCVRLCPGTRRGTGRGFRAKPPNQRLKLTGAAILVFRASTSLQAAPAA